MKKKFVCGLDIGTFKICVSCGMLGPLGRINILGSVTIPTRGIKAGRIIESKKVSACIKDAMVRLRKLCGLKVQRVYANIDSPDLRVKMCKGKACFGQGWRIKRRHYFDRLIDSIISAGVSLDRRVLYTGFSNLIFDNQGTPVYPQNRSNNSGNIDINIVAVTALLPTINNFIKCVKDAGLILEDMVPSGCAQALSLFRGSPPSFLPEVVNGQVASQGQAKLNAERDDLLIDIGAGQTKITLLENRLVKDIVLLPVGAQDITEDIAMKLKLSNENAEQLKIKYGQVHSLQGPFSEKVILYDRPANKIVQSQRLCEIITYRVDCLLQEIKKALLKLGYKDERICEFVVTGGGSVMEGFLERAEQAFGKQVKMGFLHAIKDQDIQWRSASYATSIGLIHFGLTRPWSLKNRFSALANKGLSRPERFNSITSIISQTRKLYAEYF